jgi:hypothetical protein
MADYVFQADPAFNRVILQDIEGNKVFVNSQLELDYYTAPREGGPINGSYWESVGFAGVIPQPVLEQAEQEYTEKASQGDVVISPEEDLANLDLSGPDGSGGGEGDNNGDGSVVVNPVPASQTAANRFAESIPDGGEIVKSGSSYYVLYPIPGTNLSLSYEATEDDIKGLYPLDFSQQTFRQVSDSDISLTVPFGNIAELYDPRFLAQGQTPWEGFVDYLDKEADLRPWLEDEEMVFLLAESVLEGRTVTEAEWKTTNWWRTSTQDKRDWLLLSQGKPSDELPADALSKLEDDKIIVRNSMIEAGVSNPPDNLINWVANQLTTGLWTKTKTLDQIAFIADPSKPGSIDVDLQDFITGGEIAVESTVSGQDRVEQLYKRYLGPVFGNINDNLRAVEANKLRNDPNYEFKLIEKLMAQKKSLFPQYGEDVTYEEFAAPWENFTTNQWGQQIDTSSATFQEVLKLNDSVKAGQYLTQQGLSQGVDKVVNEALESLKVFGQGVRIN